MEAPDKDFVKQHVVEITKIIDEAFALSRPFSEWRSSILLPFACHAQIDPAAFQAAGDKIGAKEAVIQAAQSLSELMKLPIDEFEGKQKFLDGSILDGERVWDSASSLADNFVSHGLETKDSPLIKWLLSN